jgi:hypothetical protein
MSWATPSFKVNMTVNGSLAITSFSESPDLICTKIRDQCLPAVQDARVSVVPACRNYWVRGVDTHRAMPYLLMDKWSGSKSGQGALLECPWRMGEISHPYSIHGGNDSIRSLHLQQQVNERMEQPGARKGFAILAQVEIRTASICPT